MMIIGKYQRSVKLFSKIFQRQNHLKTHCSNNSLENEQLNDLIDQYKSKIIYNSVINKIIGTPRFHKRTPRLRKKLYIEETLERLKVQCTEPLPFSLKYFNSTSQEEGERSNESIEQKSVENSVIYFPFGDQNTTALHPVNNANEFITELDSFKPTNVADDSERGVNERRELLKNVNYNKWMTDYENYEEANDESEYIQDTWKINYGTPDLNSKISNIPCGGCGALLHCRDTAIPGYIPSEIYNNTYRREGLDLKSIVCQRCHFLQNYNLALQIRVSSEDYPKVLETIKEKFALIILMVDLLDFPCSIWPGIANTLGENKPIVVVGNKVDLLPRESPGYLNRITETLRESVQSAVGAKTARKIQHVCLISAKTGWGVEEFITKLHNIRHTKGDVYLVGCTNVGKSTLFNCLLQSDFCKVQAVDLVQRATTSVWPGTTLNLLKFPILRPSGWKLYVRTQRLKSMRKIIAAERRLNKIQLQQTKDPKYATLIGHLDRTFQSQEVEEKDDPFAVYTNAKSTGKIRLGINERDPVFITSKWCYDTPGVVQPDQILHLLTTEELTLTLPRQLIKPQTLGIRVGQTLFIAGIGRLDYLEGHQSIKFTVFCAEELPITMCYTEDADLIYEKLLGSPLFKVPVGPEERMNKWPSLKSSDLLELTSTDKFTSCADIVLSNAGWIAVTSNPGPKISFRAWTPEGRGIYVRKSLLPYAVKLRGHKIRQTPTYTSDKVFVPIK